VRQEPRLAPLSKLDLVLDFTLQPICRMIALTAREWVAAPSTDRESVGSKEISQVWKHESCWSKIIFFCSVVSVLHDYSRLFACGAFAANVMNSLFNSGYESVCGDP
jgi:hypothetical protein